MLFHCGVPVRETDSFMTLAKEDKTDWIQGGVTTMGLIRGEKLGSMLNETGRGICSQGAG